VASLRRSHDGDWHVCDDTGATIARSRVVAFCNGDGALGAAASPWPLRRQRGQLSAVAASSLAPHAPPRLPIAGAGYVLPEIGGKVWFGASASWDDDERALHQADHDANIERLTSLLALPAAPELGALAGGVGFRFVSDDRLPIVGAMPASVAAQAIEGFEAFPSTRLDQPRFVARAPGLFVLCGLGSRGIASSALAAEVLAAIMTGAPVPAEADLLDAIDPARFLSRRHRRGEAARQAASAQPAQPPVGPIAGSAGT
jgi:tRNA 5-methylaminomethyl-2-thiouridine biosynthesis bifunctional protein